MVRILRGCRYRGIEGLEECESNSKDRNRFAASVLRPYFSVPSSGDIHIASQSDRKNPIHNPARLFLNFQPRRVYNQVTRAAVSVPSNIAEGSERQTSKEFIRFLYIAKGSVAELRTQIYIAGKLNIISSADMKTIADEAMEISCMLQGLISSIKKAD